MNVKFLSLVVAVKQAGDRVARRQQTEWMLIQVSKKMNKNFHLHWQSLCLPTGAKQQSGNDGNGGQG